MLLFDRYQYEPSTDCIGRGEFSLVYEALDTHIYLPVAVKIYRATDPGEKFGFVQVNKFMGLDHPNICRYMHIGEITRDNIAGEQEKRQVCVMELLRDGDFASYYQAHRQPELLRKMVLDILHGLTYLHSQRIVHRRLKSSNLLVGMTTQGPVVKITDFGLGWGKAASRDSHLSSMVVEVERMAPEQFNPQEYGVNGNISYHIDFWALGLAVYEAFTDNDALFKNDPRDSREQVIRNILSPKLSEKVEQLPAPFNRLVKRCMAKYADQRPANTRELIELLAQPLTNIYPVYKEERMMKEEGVAKEDKAAVNGRVVEGRDAKEERVAMASMGPATDASAVTEEVIVQELPVRSREPHPFFTRYEYNPRDAFIGKGGFSRVYKAFDKKLNRWVALKFFKSGDVVERRSPAAEIRRVINLDHPNICRYLDIEELEKENVFGEKEVTQICVMELLDGGNLHEYYAAHRTREVLLKLLTDVLKGLAYLHRNGIIHRDIKPANILIRETSEGPVAKITDFGVSKVSDATKTTHPSTLVVSIPYMAPEQLNIKSYGINEKIAYNLDLWALGVTIYEVITGKVLFKNGEDDGNEEIMANILAPGLQDRITGLPEPFLSVVQRCLVKNAAQRAQGAEELIELLNKPVEVAPQPIVERMPQKEVEKVIAEERAALEPVAIEPVVIQPAAVAEPVDVEPVVIRQAAAVVAEPVEAVAELVTAELVAVAGVVDKPVTAEPVVETKMEPAIPRQGAIPVIEAVAKIPAAAVKPKRSRPEMSRVLAAMNGTLSELKGILAELRTAVPAFKEWNTGLRITVAAVTVVVIMVTYMLIQAQRLTNMLQALPPKGEVKARRSSATLTKEKEKGPVSYKYITI